ncbi:hypothetical protein R1sor_010283 [Riccia sorocarpa]|uniref:SAM domain-containing protein n=1 Tax=Riccia sorocarpa TaxID=122646 RepID=A0ABD3I190_9MARC
MNSCSTSMSPTLVNVRGVKRKLEEVVTMLADLENVGQIDDKHAAIAALCEDGMECLQKRVAALEKELEETLHELMEARLDIFKKQVQMDDDSRRHSDELDRLSRMMSVLNKDVSTLSKKLDVALASRRAAANVISVTREKLAETEVNMGVKLFDKDGSVQATVDWVGSFLGCSDYSVVLADEAVNGSALRLLAKDITGLKLIGFKSGHAANLLDYFERLDVHQAAATSSPTPDAVPITPTADPLAGTTPHTHHRGSEPDCSRKNLHHPEPVLFFALLASKPCTCLSSSPTMPTCS